MRETRPQGRCGGDETRSQGDIKTNGIPKDSAPLLFRSVSAESDCRGRSFDEAGLQTFRAYADLEGGSEGDAIVVSADGRLGHEVHSLYF